MNGQSTYESDVFQTDRGELAFTFLGHGSLLINLNGAKIFIDPYSQVADYSLLPKADAILITHEHRDHLDPQALAHIRTDRTQVLLNPAAADQVQGGKALRNGERGEVAGISILAVPAYNLVHKRPTGEPFHPRGVGNGYILDFAGLRVYVAGDTENIPEMAELKAIDIAFLPMNLPYTMTPEMVAAAARAFRPKILYPYHYGSTDPAELVKLLEDERDIEVRIRKLA
jgi:L-ascorbate metabolism protein UlaG (beta-lactamase superfamily)